MGASAYCWRFFALLLMSSVASPQAQVSRDGLTLTPLVRDAIDAALPTKADLSARMWEQRDIAEKISKEELEERWEKKIEPEYRRRAYRKLQPVENLSNQLGLLVTVLRCAVSIDEKLRNFAIEPADVDSSWSKIEASWKALSTQLACVSGTAVRLNKSPSGESVSSVRDPVITGALLQVFRSVEIASSEVRIAIKERDQDKLFQSTNMLSREVNQFYLVSAIQMTIVSGDVHDLVATKGSPSNVDAGLIESLRKLIEIHTKS